MPAAWPAPQDHADPRVHLALTVNNHPGVMSHVCGLFARRACNVEGILCMPLGDGARSTIWLVLHDDEKLPLMLRQVEKLEDVLSVRRHEPDAADFAALAAFFAASAA
ncbi:MAG: acetolactate synthase small subunit [Desulfovibrionaceae bacterium]